MVGVGIGCDGISVKASGCCWSEDRIVMVRSMEAVVIVFCLLFMIFYLQYGVGWW